MDLQEIISNNWLQFTVGYLAFVKIITVIRDAIDATPTTDDNWFERGATVIKKIGESLILGKRAK